ncbi:hypothetical protein TIFTF001_038015 [Ficus carica]|uniref:MULE transposase domain-containing protein n=1 Tax=Ficus carica TaxID=3494 RepID=A0AA88E9T3_FICCA|nr:hypothetical protein TIFTF001_038015 [Ficus carica]
MDGGILVPDTATYVGLIELVRSEIGIRGPDKTIVIRYGVEPGRPLVRIQCDADVKFYIQLKKNDVHLLSKFPITIHVLDESAVEAMPPEVGESNHIDVQPSREGGQSDEAMQHVNDSNLIILPPRPPHIPSPTVDNEGCPWQLCATRMRGSELFVMKRYDDVHTCSIEIVQGYHRQVKSWMIGECVKAKYLDPTDISYRPREIMQEMQAEFGVSFNYLRAWQGKEAALTSLRGNDAESYKVNFPYLVILIVVDGSALKARFGGMLLAACGHNANDSIFPLAFGIIPLENNESWKWFFEKLRDSIGMRESLVIVADKYKGIEYAANLVYPDATFGICVQHLAANLKTRYKDFKGPLKTYFDGASRSYLLSEHHRHMESICGRNPDMHRYLVQADPTKWS